MIKKFLAWCRRETAIPLVGETVYESLLNQLEDVDDLVNKPFKHAKARSVLLETATVNLDDLSQSLIYATTAIREGQVLSAKWQRVARVYELGTLDSFITDGSELLHPIDWIVQHKPYIAKLVDAFMTMDHADHDYYQRKCIFVVNDLLALLKASRECLR